VSIALRSGAEPTDTDGWPVVLTRRGILYNGAFAAFKTSPRPKVKLRWRSIRMRSSRLWDSGSNRVTG